MKRTFFTTLGLLSLVAIAPMQAIAGPTVHTAGPLIAMGGGFFGISGSITADPALDLFVTSSSVTFTDGFGQLGTNFIDGDHPTVTAGNSYAGHDNTGALNGNGFYLVLGDYTQNPPPQQIQATGTITINFREGSVNAADESITVPFTTAADVPEPGVLSLLAGGAISGGLFLRRRRSK